MAVSDWNSNYLLIGTLEGIAVSEGLLQPPDVNDLFRKMAAAIRQRDDQSYAKDKNVWIQATGGSAPAGMVDGDILIEYVP